MTLPISRVHGHCHGQQGRNRRVEIVARGIHVVQPLDVVEDEGAGVDGEVPDLIWACEFDCAERGGKERTLTTPRSWPVKTRL